MRLLRSLSALLLVASTAHATSSWGFSEGTVSVKSKKGNEATEKLSATSPLKKPLTLDTGDSLKIILTATDNGKPKRPHQAFVILREEDSGLEAPFAMTVKESGKVVVDIPQKDLPVQLLLTNKPLRASIVIGSFGSAKALSAPVFNIVVHLDSNSPSPKYEKPLRYGRLPEIHHTFRSDPKSPPKVISLFFAAAVLVTVPALFGAWLILGANVAHLQKAMSAAPVSHAVFFGSIVAMEGVFFMYYSSWNLFQTLPVIGVVGAAAFLSGAKALGEVQSRRLAGER